MSKEPRATAIATVPPVEVEDEESTPHPNPHPTVRLHSTNTNTNTTTNGAVTYTENKTNALDINIHEYQLLPRQRSLLLSDSEISVLDLGPSLEFEFEFEVEVEAEGDDGSGTLRPSEGKHGYDHGQRNCRGEGGKLGPGPLLAVPGRKVSIEETTGAGGGAAVRIISSPLVSPLRTTKKGNSGKGKVREWELNADTGVEGKRLEEG